MYCTLETNSRLFINYTSIQKRILAEALPQSSTGEGSVFKLSYLGVGRIPPSLAIGRWFLSVLCHMGFSTRKLPARQLASSEQEARRARETASLAFSRVKLEFGNLILPSTFSVLSSLEARPVHTLETGIPQGHEHQEMETWGHGSSYPAHSSMYAVFSPHKITNVP